MAGTLFIIALIFTVIGVISIRNEEYVFGTLLTLLGGVLIAHDDSSEQEYYNQIQAKMEQCEKSLPRDQKCIILIEAVPDVNTKG